MISRETTRLLVTIAVSVAVLWALARLRFHEHRAAPSAVAPVLAQLRPAASFDDLARAIADLRPLLAAAVLPIGSGSALRIAGDRAVALDPNHSASIIATDRATGLAVVEVRSAEPVGLMPWAPRQLDYPRFLFVADIAGDGVVIRPIFAGALTAVRDAYWDDEVWQLPPATDLPPGRFVFTIEGALAGLSISRQSGAAIVPAVQVLDVARRIAASPLKAPGTVGVEVLPLSRSLAAASGAQSGVMVAMVDSEGPAASLLAPSDVIETFNGRHIATIDDWHAQVRRLAAGDAVSLRVLMNGERREVKVSAIDPASEEVPARQDLGLRLAAVTDRGSRVVSVQPGSHGAQVPLQSGDLITAVGRQTAPTPAQVVRAFASVPSGDALIFSYMRGTDRHLAAIRKAPNTP